MRVSQEVRVAGQRRDAGRRGDFGAALQRAEARRTEAARADAGKAARRAGARLEAAREGEARGRPGGTVEGMQARGSGGAAAAAAAGGPAASAGPAAEAPALGAVHGGGPGVGGGVGPAIEPGRLALAQAVRALPPVIEAFDASARPSLAIDFGGALGVELSQAPGGVEVSLLVSAALRPAARVELAGLCRALAARGVAVVCAEVRCGRPGRGSQR